MRADVLVDLTPLDTTSRYRGIGNYVRELARALDALSPSERHGLVLAGLVSLDGMAPEGPLLWPGSQEEPEEQNETPWRWARRTKLVTTLLRLRPRLLHATQPVGMPRGSFVPRI